MQMHQAVWDKSTPDFIYTRSLTYKKCRKICSHYKLGNGFVDFGIQITPSMIHLLLVLDLFLIILMCVFKF